MPPAVCAASLAALKIVDNQPGLRESLLLNRRRFAAGIEYLGINIGSSETPILPLMIGEPAKALKTGDRLIESGIFATAIRPPTVPEGKSRIRMTVMANHTDADIDTVLGVLNTLHKEGLFS